MAEWNTIGRDGIRSSVPINVLMIISPSEAIAACRAEGVLSDRTAQLSVVIKDYRNLIQAGWTGPAQITKGSTDPVSYLELDRAYVNACRTLSPGRLLRYDLNILAKTALVILRGQGLQY